MKKQLFLIRHSLANAGYPGQKDKERDLTEGGSVRAMQLANHFAQQKVQPQAIYSSSAQRAERTANYLAEKLLADHRQVQFSDDIYESSVRILVGLLNQFPEDYKVVMLVGHNPILQYLAEYLAGESLESLEPGGYYQLEIDGTYWNELSQGSIKEVLTVAPSAYAIV